MDPNLGPWEVAKLFLPDLGGPADIESAVDMDITGILNLMYWCNHFTVHQPLIKEVRDTPNNKWVHLPKLELTDAEKTDAFNTIENLLKDALLVPDSDAQKALKEILNLRKVSAWHSLEALVLADFKEALNREMQMSERTQNEVEQLKQLVLPLVEKRLEVIEQGDGLLFQMLNNFVRSLKPFKKGIVVPWVMILLYSFVVVLDDNTVIRDGKWKCLYTMFH